MTETSFGSELLPSDAGPCQTGDSARGFGLSVSVVCTREISNLTSLNHLRLKWVRLSKRTPVVSALEGKRFRFQSPSQASQKFG